MYYPLKELQIFGILIPEIYYVYNFTYIIMDLLKLFSRDLLKLFSSKMLLHRLPLNPPQPQRHLLFGVRTSPSLKTSCFDSYTPGKNEQFAPENRPLEIRRFLLDTNIF